mgnify:CR=1 FL=1
MTKKEIVYHLKWTPWRDLAAEADAVRRRYVGELVHLRGVIEFSTYCCRNCLYCGLRRDNTNIERYRMSVAEVLDTAVRVNRNGIRTIVLQSGDDMVYPGEDIGDMIYALKKTCPDTAITLSVGERPDEDYVLWRNAGADRYLLRHETANPDLYRKLHPGRDLEKRVNILHRLRELGYQIGAGSLTGLPGQTVEDMADDILFLQKLDPDMAGIGPFLPQADTAFSSCSAGDPEMTLKMLALVRILTQDTHLPATTALETLLGVAKGHEYGLEAGCNVIMPAFTPSSHRAKYRIYDDKARVTKDKTVDTIKKAGRSVGTNRGDSLKKR